MAPYLGGADEPNGRPKLQHVHCSGTPYEIGYQHGTSAQARVHRTIAFYTKMFQETAKMDWSQVQELALTYEPTIASKWPHYLEEMRGLAAGASVSLADIIACNVRTEIAFGLFSDGCTALSWLTSSGTSYLAQNWDWAEAQKESLILLTIDQKVSKKPMIKMVTEAGLIGKIGLNSSGVGVCLNAIRIKGMDATRLPCHLGLRMVLDSESRDEAVEKLCSYGIASACHMLIADATGGIGLEWSSSDVQKCTMNTSNQVFHANHYLLPHPTAGVDTNWLVDSTYRTTRIEELARKCSADPSREQVFEMFKDETNFPGAICRAQKGGSTAASLFNIVMDLGARWAGVTLGRPVDPDDYVELTF